MANAALSVLLLVIVTRLTDTASSDVFSLGWAVAQIMFTIGCFQVRLYQATDASGRFGFRQYLKYRGITIFAMIIASVGYVIINGHTGTKASVILLLCGYKLVDALSDVYQGWFQHKERLDLAGKALTARVAAALVFFTLVLWIKHDIVWACISINISSWICFFLFDIRYIKHSDTEEKQNAAKGKKWILELTIQCLPLFINFFLVNTIFNAPKLAIDNAILNNELAAGAQTAYSIIFMPAFCINLIYLVFRHIITRMAISWQERDFFKYTRYLTSILLSLLAISAAVCLAGWFLGIPVLQFIYSVDLTGLRPAFMILLAGGCFNAFINAFDNAITVMRKQYALLPMYLITTIEMTVLAPVMIHERGIQGASITFLTSQITLLVLLSGLFLVYYRREKAHMTMENENGEKTG